jgi:glycine C-acetyltransferase
MYGSARGHVQGTLDEIREAGLWKSERIITGPQEADIHVEGREGTVINFCANNYLGLSDDARVIDAAKGALDTHGFGLSSVRFICGTQDAHKALERDIASFLGTDDSILYAACFDANGGLFETLLGPEDAIISDQLNHASIIDGIRLCKAERHRYAHMDMDDLRAKLEATRGKRMRLISTDGVFSMDGDIAPLPQICDLADEFDALVMIDDCHATGFVGKTGRGTPEHHGVEGRIDIITSTLGKALGGASGGFTAARQEIVDLLRQRSRPYLFSNTLAPAIVGASREVLRMLSGPSDLIERLNANTKRFREAMTEAGFDVRPGTHPIVPVMLGDARLATGIADDLLERGIYVIGFSFPVVPRGQARIRVQLSAAHTPAHVERAIEAFVEVGRKHGVIN